MNMNNIVRFQKKAYRLLLLNSGNG